MPRGSLPSYPGGGGGGNIIVAPPYYPYYPYYGYGYGYPYYGFGYGWGYGGFGFAVSYSNGFYGPWGYPYGGVAYAPGPYDGALRLRVTPADATVYVDGYYAGRVEDFDGTFQRLHLEPGAHQVEVKQDGFETLMFEVKILPDRTITYTGDMKKQ